MRTNAAQLAELTALLPLATQGPYITVVALALILLPDMLDDLADLDERLCKALDERDAAVERAEAAEDELETIAAAGSLLG